MAEQAPAPAPAPPGTMLRAHLVTAALYVVVCLTWGTTWLGIKIAVETVPPLTAAGVRFVVTFPLLLALARLRGEPLLFPRDRRGFFVFVTLTYFVIPYFLINYGEQHVSSGLTALLFSTVPVFTLILSAFLLGERITIGQVTGITIGFVSLLLLLVSERAGLGHRGLAGVAAILCAALMHAVAYVVTKRSGSSVSVVTYNTLPIGIAGATLLLTGFVVERPDLGAVSGQSLAALAYLGIVASTGGFVTYFYLLKRASPVFLSFIFIIFPVVSLVIGNWYEGRQMSWQFALLFALLMLGFVMTKVPPWRRSAWHKRSPDDVR